MKIAVPTEATAGTRIAMQPTTIASTPIVIRPFQLRARPARTSGSSDAPPISMAKSLGAPADDSDDEAALPIPDEVNGALGPAALGSGPIRGGVVG